MKKVNNSKSNAPKSKTDKISDSGEGKKVQKLKPLKEKKGGWKNKLGEEDDDFIFDDDIKINDHLEDEEELNSHYDDDF